VQVDELQGGKVSLGLSMVVRITLKDGTYHEVIRVLIATPALLTRSRTSAMAQ
jgi:hypothetical protein